ncbi:putative ubiquinol-cytochrome-c reductase complex core protein mitochondrial precursor [Erysiphe necator]|uniref:Cytochrome b-c1 complex subunit 2, mitochondrial n=1 Tax=Uncinula necator TaxID=52586 RepID=A0A0B1PAF5_UNCNE|nr:putative ubiquinol-cytochrome-c reductase complex core protein mitochondrial precursor [Erysiphe necator]
MFYRSATGKNVQYMLRGSHYSRSISKRGLATSSLRSTSLTYGIADAAGVKIACNNVAGPTTRLAVFAKAGTRYQTAPGIAAGLSLFAFKNTNKRTALRITRESELLGGQLKSHHDREFVMLEAKFLRQDLPFFTELLSEVISETRFTTYEFEEQVAPLLKLSQKRFTGNASEVALDVAHNVAFHHGLGTSLYPNLLSPTSKYINSQTISQYSGIAYSKKNIAIIVNGADMDELAKWVGEFFTGVPSGVSALSDKPTKYYGGEERVHHPTGNSIVIAYPGSSMLNGPSYTPEIFVLAALLGGQSTIKWTKGFSLLAQATSHIPHLSTVTSHFAYSDSGLLSIHLNGSPEALRQASLEVKKTLKRVAEGQFTKEDLTKAISLAKFKALDDAQNVKVGLLSTGTSILHNQKTYQFEEIGKTITSVNADSLKVAAQKLLTKKATVSTVGDLHMLPFAEEIGF